MVVDTKESRKSKPTLRTIADLAGLAVPTVSRALNDAPDIGRETKARVRRIADEVGYVPNRAGVRLRTGRTNVISVIMSTENDLTNHTGRFVSAIAEQLQGTAFHMNYTPFFAAEDPMRAVRYIVETRSADALILNQTEPEDPRVAYLMERGFPFVTHGRTNWSDQHPYYDVCNADIGRLAVEFLSGRGRRKLLLVAPPRGQAYGRDMRLAAQGAAVDIGVELTVECDVTSDDSRDAVVRTIRRRMAEHPEIDGIITASSSAAMSASAGLEAEGRMLGRDIDLFSKETTVPLLELFRPQIHSIKEDVTEAGAYCGKAAIHAIRNPDARPMQLLRNATTADIREGAPAAV